jgi:hypothetical protein
LLIADNRKYGLFVFEIEDSLFGRFDHTGLSGYWWGTVSLTASVDLNDGEEVTFTGLAQWPTFTPMWLQFWLGVVKLIAPESVTIKAKEKRRTDSIAFTVT